MVLGIQVIGLFFGLFMLYYTFLHFKRKDFTIKEFVFWIIVWILFAIVSLFPDILDFVTRKLNFVRTLDLLIVAGFMALIAMFFYVYTLVRQNQKRIEEVVRKIAIEKKVR